MQNGLCVAGPQQILQVLTGVAVLLVAEFESMVIEPCSSSSVSSSPGSMAESARSVRSREQLH